MENTASFLNDQDWWFRICNELGVKIFLFNQEWKTREGGGPQGNAQLVSFYIVPETSTCIVFR